MIDARLVRDQDTSLDLGSTKTMMSVVSNGLIQNWSNVQWVCTMDKVKTLSLQPSSSLLRAWAHESPELPIL